MIKTKLDNPKDKLVKELNEQKQKVERIRKAYINGSFTIEEYDSERKIVEEVISNLETKIKDCDICEELKFTPEDILIKRDIDYINKIVYPDEYEEHTYMWKDYTRKEKADLIMRYVDNVELEYYGNNKVRLGEVYFRESICKSMNELYDAGYLDKVDYALLGNVVTKLRFSEYLPIEKVSEIIFTLRQYYNVGYFEATYYYDDKVMFFNNYENRNIVRVFPIEDYKKIDKIDKLQLGVIYIEDGEKCLLDNKEEGRNIDINVANMNEYKKIKREQEKYKKELKELNSKADELQNKSSEINNIVDSLKPTLMNKNNYTISSDDVDKIKKYIEQTNDTTSNLRDTNDMNIILKKYEDDLREHSNEVRNLNKKIKNRDERIEDLENRLEFANDTIDMLEDKVSKLQETLNYFKELWKKFIEFLQDKFFFNNKYDDFIQELNDEEIIDDNDLGVIRNEYISYSSKGNVLDR